MQMMKQWCCKHMVFSALVVSSVLSVTGPSEASLVKFAFDGAIAGVEGVLVGKLGTGSMNGDVTFDSGTAPLVPGTGLYFNAIKGLNLYMNGVQVASYTSGSNGMFIQNSPQLSGADTLTAFSTVTGGIIGGVRPVSYSMSLSDSLGKVFDNENLPTSPPSLGSFNRNQWRLDFGGTGNYVTGSLAHLTAVPLPAGVVLFGIGLISLVGLGAGGLRNLRVPRA